MGVSLVGPREAGCRLKESFLAGGRRCGSPLEDRSRVRLEREGEVLMLEGRGPWGLVVVVVVVILLVARLEVQRWSLVLALLYSSPFSLLRSTAQNRLCFPFPTLWRQSLSS